jgi:hypothetical protein
MANQGLRGKATRLVPMAHVVDVQRSIDFYKLLAMDLLKSLKSHEGDLRWAYLACEQAELILARRKRAHTREPAGRSFLFLLARSHFAARTFARLRCRCVGDHVSQLHAQGRDSHRGP